MGIAKILTSILVLCTVYKLVGAVELDSTSNQDTKLEDKPIIVGKGNVANILRKWYSEGTAAGNVGDWYDNRDRGHSNLRMSFYPQLQKVTYTSEQLRHRQDWGAQRIILPHVTFGNSSTSAHPERGGSIPRNYYTRTQGLEFLFGQYIRNNLYIYPEHHDHDPGRNGIGGYGDLYPTNTPFLVISQGSSGSDKPFMRAIPQVSAAFRPEVKAKLIKAGMLMPTLQMILRMNNKNISGRKEYLSGKAHPTVFSGKNLDVLAMVKMAHEITIDTLPPIALLEVVREEREMVTGKDFFDPGASEKLCDTPIAIARVFRGSDYQRKMVVRVSEKGDVNNRPLTFHWIVLRGDNSRIRIRKLKDDGSLVELTVPYHQRRPITPSSAMESSRVDIGVFTHNGKYFSPPSFITFFSLDNEARTYDSKGHILEIGYGSGTPHLAVSDWIKLFDMLKPETISPSALILKAMIEEDELESIATAATEYKIAHAITKEAIARQKNIESTKKKDDANLKEAQQAVKNINTAYKKIQTKKTLAELNLAQEKLEAAKTIAQKTNAQYKAVKKDMLSARKAESKMLNKTRPALKSSVKTFIEGVFKSLAETPNLLVDNTGVILELYDGANDAAKAAFTKEHKRLISFGVIANKKSPIVEIVPILKDNSSIPQKLSTYERKMLLGLNASGLENLVFPDVITNSTKRDYVDQRITAPKYWRDVYHYDVKGNRTGWTRYDGKNSVDFNSDGMLVLEMDSEGRCTKAQNVTYDWYPFRRNSKGKVIEYNNKPLKFRPGKEIVYYEYNGPNDTEGQPKFPRWDSDGQ
jgi:hypothetical protein